MTRIANDSSLFSSGSRGRPRLALCMQRIERTFAQVCEPCCRRCAAWGGRGTARTGARRGCSCCWWLCRTARLQSRSGVGARRRSRPVLCAASSQAPVVVVALLAVVTCAGCASAAAHARSSRTMRSNSRGTAPSPAASAATPCGLSTPAACALRGSWTRSAGQLPSSHPLAPILPCCFSLVSVVRARGRANERGGRGRVVGARVWKHVRCVSCAPLAQSQGRPLLPRVHLHEPSDAAGEAGGAAQAVRRAGGGPCGACRSHAPSARLPAPPCAEAASRCLSPVCASPG
jgi:hypothetical protein